VNVLFGEFARQAAVVSRYIDGVYLNRAFVGQEGYTQPLTPVPESEQKNAMNTLFAFVFAPDAIDEMAPFLPTLSVSAADLAVGTETSPLACTTCY
jgi:hypothetical protein